MPKVNYSDTTNLYDKISDNIIGFSEENSKTEIFMNYPDVVTVDAMCKMLGIGRNKAYELLKNGQIHNVRIGRKHIIPKSSIINFLLNS